VQALRTKRFSAACKGGPSWGYSQPDFSKLAFWSVIDRDTSSGRVRWYPTQAKKRLEWGTQPLLLVQGVGAKAVVPPERSKRLIGTSVE
jgi:hypothetical protein